MRVRRLIVTRESNIKDIDALANHPNVRECWRLPHDYVLFESYYPVFERIYHNDPSIKHAARAEEIVRLQTAAAMGGEREILGPLFKEQPASFRGVQLLIPGTTAFTQFLGSDAIKWPEVKLYTGWETATDTVFSMNLAIVTEDTERELRRVIQQWTDSGKAQGKIEAVGPVTFKDKEAQVRCRFIGPTCADAIMALYVLLTDTQTLTSLKSFARVTTSTPFAEPIPEPHLGD
jgi:hypothetical protein